jgi:hypothetical protein
MDNDIKRIAKLVTGEPDVLKEASWSAWSAKDAIKRSGFWKDNAPAEYKEMDFTDPRIPKKVHIQVAKKHPNGLQGARSAVQSFINLKSASPKKMERLEQIAQWLSDEIAKAKG